MIIIWMTTLIVWYAVLLMLKPGGEIALQSITIPPSVRIIEQSFNMHKLRLVCGFVWTAILSCSMEMFIVLCIQVILIDDSVIIYVHGGSGSNVEV